MGLFDTWIKNRLKGEIEDLLKADGDEMVTGNVVPDVPEDDTPPSDQIGRRAVLDDPYYDYVTQQVIYKTKLTRLTNRTLKDVSIRDWVVSAIIQARCDTLLQFARTSHKKLDPGFRIVKIDGNAEYSDEDKKEVAALESFLYHCGRTDNVPEEDRMLFGEFLKLSCRDALTFGHICIEKIKTRRGGLHRFRPIPAESTYLINKRTNKEYITKEVIASKHNYVPGNNDPKSEYQINEPDIDFYKYVQVSYDNRVLGVFGDEDMIWGLFNPQNFADSRGYCYSPLELAILNVTNHLNVENYNSNFFTHGYAARGVLHLKGTVTQAQLIAFRRQFYNSISGAQHAWRTPVIAGLEEVQWVPMSGSAKEMEYINFNNHIMRAICAQFQVDPIELGLDYLISSNGRAPMQQGSNEYKIEHSRERGFFPILMFFEDIINRDVIPAIDKDLAHKYKFVFTGYTDASPQTEIAQMQAEMTVHSSMNDLLLRAEKPKINIDGADLPLNQAFWNLIEKNLTRGEIREKFFGDKGASKNPQLQYIPADPGFLAWQQLIMTKDRLKKQDKQMEEQAKQQQEQQELEAKHAEGQHSREEEMHAHGMEQAHSQAAHAAVAHGNSTKDVAKEVGVGSKPLEIGGSTTANPINTLGKSE